MDGHDRAAVASFFTPEPIGDGATVVLGKEAAHHARVRRVAIGERVRLLDGNGGIGTGTLVRVTKSQLTVEISGREWADPPPPVHLLVPIADRDRMLMLAEKCAELGLTTWRPVLWRRSRSVMPRGEGSAFQGRVRARMIGALEQSGGGWLPVIYPDSRPEHAIAAVPPGPPGPPGVRLLLAPPPRGVPLGSTELTSPATIALGPEGGFEDDELAMLTAAGFAATALGGNVLRFETAGIAAVAIVRALMTNPGGTTDAR
ncbi:MAG TPA: RsmE family RNA methyltransferase [Gemmatimonadaceae bacterium]|nr:RsmE family RNA methyltransferase [Gemmatimonadaceae bacterium]